METEVRGLFDLLVANPPTSSVNVEAAIRDGRRRLVRRRQVWVGTASAAALAGAATFSALTDGKVPATENEPGPISTVGPSLPNVLEVTCTKDSVRLSAEVIRAQSTGAVLVVSSTMKAGAYLRYHSTGSGGTSGATADLPARPTTWTLSLSPGTVTLGCYDARADQPRSTATVRVTDPDGYWHGTEAVDRLSCGGGFRDGNGPFVQEAETRAGAAQAVADAWAQSQRRVGTYSVRPVVVAYVDDPTETWLVLLNGHPRATVLVTKKGDHYAATGPVMTCGPGPN